MATIRKIGAAFVLAFFAGSSLSGAAFAQSESAEAAKPEAAKSDDAAAALHAATAKFNAYVEFLNRTLRASESLDRYKSWVNMTTGPTGHERIIYGLYQTYDTSKEAEAATAALTQAPLLPELDAAMRDYIAANEALARSSTKRTATTSGPITRWTKWLKARSFTPRSSPPPRPSSLRGRKSTR
jgi:hypothetical protein